MTENSSPWLYDIACHSDLEKQAVRGRYGKTLPMAAQGSDTPLYLLIIFEQTKWQSFTVTLTILRSFSS